MEPARSDLVAHFRLDARIYDDYTIIVKKVRGKRNTKREEKWVRSNKRPFAGGGFGQVWLEHEETNPSNVRAVKVIRKPQTQREFQVEYEQELYALAALSKHHDSVAEFFGWWEDDYDVFLAMEYFPHRDLTNCVKAELPEWEVRDITSQILEALQILHGMGITHRDLKPQNILVVDPGPSWWVKIGDFGISKRIGQDTALQTRQIGTIAFMAPEVLDEDTDEAYTNAVDLWAVGCIAYSLLTLNNMFTDRKAIRQYAKGDTSLNAAWQQLGAGKASPMCIDFLRTLLSAKGEDRPSATMALQSAWIKSQLSVENKDASGSKSDETTVTGAFTSPFGSKNPFKQASFTTLPGTGETVGSQYSSAIVVSNSGSFASSTQPTTAGSRSQLSSPPSFQPRTAAPPGMKSDNQGCNARCKCAICFGCSWNAVPNNSRNEHVMHSCGTGCFGTQPLCTDCLKRIDGGLYACPRCREVPEETYTRKIHQTSGLSGANSANSAKPTSPAPPPKTSGKAPETTQSPPTSLPTPLSQQTTVVSPPTEKSEDGGLGSSLPPLLDQLTQALGSLVLNSTTCNVCEKPSGNGSWICLACKGESRPFRTCQKCRPRGVPFKAGTVWQTRCASCSSERCYLIDKEEASSSSQLFAPLSSSITRCNDSCKCNKCGVCALQLASHWKCKLCLRPRCNTCAKPTSSSPAVPWCTNSACRSEMMSPAEKNKFEVLSAPLSTAMFNILRPRPSRPFCEMLGCSCDQCGNCSKNLYTYMCVACVPTGYTTSKHICERCIREPLTLIDREQPTCPRCFGTRFRAYEPKEKTGTGSIDAFRAILMLGS